MLSHFNRLRIMIALGLWAGGAVAAGLGELVVQSHLGEAFRAELPLIEAGGERQVEEACFRIEAARDADAGMPQLLRGKIVLVRENGRARLRVHSDQVINEPVLQIHVRVGCGAEVRRSYVALLDPAPVAPPRETPAVGVTPPLPASLRQTLSPPPEGASDERFPTEWTTADGESAMSIARALFPRQPSAQRRFLAALRGANPDVDFGEGGEASLAAGTALVVPDTRRRARLASLDTPSTGDGAVPPARVSPRPEKLLRPLAGAIADRLVISGDGASGEMGIGQALRLSTTLSTGLSRTTTENSRAVLRLEYKLLTALNAQVEQQLEVAEQIRGLEAVLGELRASAERATAETAAPAAEPAPVAPPAAEAVPPPASSQPETPPVETSLGLWLVISVALGVLASFAGFLIVRSRRRKAAGSTVAGDDAPVTELPAGAAASEAAWFDDPRPGSAGVGKPAGVVPDIDLDAPPSAEQAPASIGSIEFSQANPLESTDVGEANDLNTVLELADIMVCFGRVKGATQALEDYLAHEPDKALQPWLKLLEIYRANDLRDEFDACSNRLRLHFNIAPVDWDAAGDALKDPAASSDAPGLAPDELLARLPTLGAFPHVRESLQRLWGTEEGAQYVERLLRDTRNGQRSGFPLALVRELLLIADLLQGSAPSA